MEYYEWALVIAGSIGVIVAIVHGVLMQKLMINPIIGQSDLPQTTRRLLPILLHFSTICWLLGGIGLITAPSFCDSIYVMPTAIVVGGFYTFGAIGNFWGTNGKHPGWVLLAIATVLIGYAILQINE